MCGYPNQQYYISTEACVVTRIVNLPDVILNMTRSVYHMISVMSLCPDRMIMPDVVLVLLYSSVCDNECHL